MFSSGDLHSFYNSNRLSSVNTEWRNVTSWNIRDTSQNIRGPHHLASEPHSDVSEQFELRFYFWKRLGWRSLNCPAGKPRFRMIFGTKVNECTKKLILPDYKSTIVYFFQLWPGSKTPEWASRQDELKVKQKKKDKSALNYSQLQNYMTAVWSQAFLIKVCLLRYVK